jgi:hypothetical protein
VRYNPCPAMYAATSSGTRPRTDFPAATRARISVAETSTRRAFSRDERNPAGIAPTCSPRTATATSASAAIPAVSRHCGRVAAVSSPITSTKRADGCRAARARSVSTVKDNPARSTSIASTSSRGSSAASRRTIANRCAGAVISADSFSGCREAGRSTSRSSASCSSASWARSRCPMCGGSKVPPRIPIRSATAVLNARWASPARRSSAGGTRAPHPRRRESPSAVPRRLRRRHRDS